MPNPDWELLWTAIDGEPGLCDGYLENGSGERCSIGALFAKTAKNLEIVITETGPINLRHYGIDLIAKSKKELEDLKPLILDLVKSGFISGNPESIMESAASYRIELYMTDIGNRVINRNDSMPRESNKERKQRMLNWVCERVREAQSKEIEAQNEG
mgnify:CR=1 FL=1